MNQTTSIRKLLIEIIASLLVLLFVYTAVSKLLHYDQFMLQLAKSPYTQKYASTAGWSLPAAELIISLLLVFKRTRLTGLYGSFLLLLLFTAYIYVMLHYSYYVPCACGGVLASLSWDQHLWFNVFFTALALTGILLTVTSNLRPRNPAQNLAAW